MACDEFWTHDIEFVHLETKTRVKSVLIGVDTIPPVDRLTVRSSLNYWMPAQPWEKFKSDLEWLFRKTLAVLDSPWRYFVWTVLGLLIWFCH